MSDKMTTAQYARKCREDFIREQGEEKLLAIEEQRRLERLDAAAEYPEPDKKYFAESKIVRDEEFL